MPKPEYPSDHVAAMRVPKGGSDCKKCEYLANEEKGLCGNEYFVKWNGSNKIPAPIDSYCSDWFEPRKAEKKAAKSADSHEYDWRRK